MTDKELKRLSRSELLELLIVQSKRVDELEKQIELSEKTMAERQIMLNELGSIAEASLQINQVFESAQAAADQYLKNAIFKCEQMEEETKEHCEQMERETKEKCDRLKWECVDKCKRMEAETKARCKKLLERVQNAMNDRK